MWTWEGKTDARSDHGGMPTCLDLAEAIICCCLQSMRIWGEGMRSNTGGKLTWLKPFSLQLIFLTLKRMLLTHFFRTPAVHNVSDFLPCLFFLMNEQLSCRQKTVYFAFFCWWSSILLKTADLQRWYQVLVSKHNFVCAVMFIKAINVPFVPRQKWIFCPQNPFHNLGEKIRGFQWQAKINTAISVATSRLKPYV